MVSAISTFLSSKEAKGQPGSSLSVSWLNAAGTLRLLGAEVLGPGFNVHPLHPPTSAASTSAFHSSPTVILGLWVFFLGSLIIKSCLEMWPQAQNSALWAIILLKA